MKKTNTKYNGGVYADNIWNTVRNYQASVGILTDEEFKTILDSVEF